MAAISAFRVTQHSQFFHFSLEIEFNVLRFINYTIPRLCSTYAVATIPPQYSVQASTAGNSAQLSSQPTQNYWLQSQLRLNWESDPITLTLLSNLGTEIAVFTSFCVRPLDTALLAS